MQRRQRPNFCLKISVRQDWQAISVHLKIMVRAAILASDS